MIKHFFKDRDCFTMVQPVETEDQLQQLDTLPDAQLRPEFVEQVAILRSRILKRVRCKRIKNKALDGEMLLELAMNYVEAINSGSWPNLDVSYRLLMKSQAERTLQTVLAVCEGQLTQLSLTAHTNESVRTIQE